MRRTSRLRPAGALVALLLATCAGPTAVLARESPSIAVQDRARALDVLDRRLAHYVMREWTPAIRARLAERRADYLAAPTTEAFREALNADLYAASHDRHLQVWVEAASRDAPATTPPPVAGTAAESTYGVREARMLDGGIAYVDLSHFAHEPEARAAIDAAFAPLAGARALILDLRWNGGGNDLGFTRVMGHMTPTPLDLGEIRLRHCEPDPADVEGCLQDGRFDVQPIRADAVAAPAFPTQPIYVLTSKDTFSAAEAVAFDLQVEGRAVVVGERTGGGGNISASMDLGPWFTVVMPIGVGVHPKAAVNWEGVGVAPDVLVPADRALETALALARQAETTGG